MGAEMVAAMMLQFGLPFTERMIQLWSDKTVITPEIWAGLKKLVLVPEDALAKVATQAGIPMDDARVVALQTLIAARQA